MRATRLLLSICCTLALSFVMTGPRSIAHSQESPNQRSRDVAGTSEEFSQENQLRDFDRHVQPFLEMYCLDCHAGEDGEAGVDLEFDQAPDVVAAFDDWANILHKIEGREMPPEDAEQPADNEREAVVRWIDAGLSNFDCAQQPAKPRTTVRRLNRTEYNHVIRDLLGVDIEPGNAFPPDEVGEGFDNLGSVLALPPLLLEKYIDAAEQVTQAMQGNEQAWDAAFPQLDQKKKISRKQVREAIGDLARRAFRRPAPDTEVDQLMSLYRTARKQSLSHSDAILFVVQGILVSPKFLFRLEEDPAAVDSARPVPLDSHAIASRLSFLLWSSLPDETLNKLADEGRLVDPEEVARQAKRMVRDPKAQAFVENFFGQWLQLRLLSSMTPDPELFPTFDQRLREAMQEETLRYLRELVQNDRSVLDILDSDYTFLNQRLAKHYGIDGVEGDEFRYVKLEDDRRGGVLTHASILTLTSNPTRTSPVKRGKWILDNILGTPPPPPPPNVPELGEGDELLGSLRERMKQHRENPSCAVCHRKMDALGFGFENFDPVGGWRDRDGRYEIDASGELPDGSTFSKPKELRQILMVGSEDFTTCLTRKMLIYALGRTLSTRDKCMVDDIVEHVKQHDHRFTELLVAVVTSPAFRFAGHPVGDES